MSTRNKLVLPCAAALMALGSARAAGQQTLKIEFPSEAPISVVSADWGSSGVTPRGGALVVNLNTSLRLKNTGQRRIRGVTLLVLAQEVTPGGKASVSVPSLNVGPGDVFPVRVDLRLLRPLQGGSGPLVRVNLDGVLFDDLSFYGPNRLHSRRSMTVWELEARRDREYFRRILAARGSAGLQQEVLMSLARQADRPRVNVQVARQGRATNLDAAREVQFAFLHFPDSPVEPVAGMARLSGRQAMAPRLEVRNRSERRVRHIAIGWILKDGEGGQFLAGSVPADLALAPGAKSRIVSETTLRFSRPMKVEAMTGFVSQVEFENGEVWIPSRENLTAGHLDRLVAPSPEEQRLTNLYRRKGLKALIAELEKF